MKKKVYVMLAWALVLVLVPACHKTENVQPNPREDIVLTKTQYQAVTDGNAFAIKWLTRMWKANEGANMCLSPFSASLALTAIANGADGNTLAQMQEVLGLAVFEQESGQEAGNGYYRYLVPALKKVDRTVDLNIANAVWIRKGFPVKESFINRMKESFDSQVEQLPFDDAALRIINQWCATQTHNRIPKILDQIDPYDRLFLTNAVYFKGLWNAPFDKKASTKGNFTNAKGQVQQVVQMYQQSEFPLFVDENNALAVAELPYGNGAFSMIVVLPHSPKALGKVLQDLDPTVWNDWMVSLRPATLNVRLPRFTMEYSTKDMMIPVLQQMGVVDAFNGTTADFSRLTPEPNVYIGLVKQNTFIQVDEAGTEAAAVTIVGLKLESAGPSGPPYDFNVNRPFLYAIKEKSTGVILFMGVMTTFE